MVIKNINAIAKRTNKNIIILQKISNSFSLLLNVFYLDLPYYSCFLERNFANDVSATY